VKNGVDVEVKGTGLVIIIEGFHIKEANIEDFTKDKPVTIRDLRMHILASGDFYQVPQINPPHK
jgi:cyanophycinase